MTTLDNGGTDKNIAYQLNCHDRPESISTFYADPNFVTLPNCVVCITSEGLAKLAKWKKRAADAEAAKKSKIEAPILGPGEVKG